MQKTINQWLHELDEPFRTQALENAKKDPDNETVKVHSLRSAIGLAFIWEDTNEGFDYWNSLFDQFLHEKHKK